MTAQAGAPAAPPHAPFPEEHWRLLRPHGEPGTDNTPFFNAAGAFLLEQGHWWCRHERVAAEILYLFQFDGIGIVDQLRAQSERQLGKCAHCILGYHRAASALRPSYQRDFEPQSVDEFFGILRARDVGRLGRCLAAGAADATACIYSVYEALRFPDVLQDAALMDAFSERLSAMLAESSVDIPPDEKLPGILLLLVHPDVAIRAWALDMAEAMGPITTTSELQASLAVFEQVMRVLEFSLFADSGSAATAAVSSAVAQPWRRYTRQPFWTGLYLLLRAVDPEPFAQLLVHFPFLVTLVLNHVGHSHLHVQAFRCLKIVCERLGQQTWEACDLNPAGIIGQLERHFRGEALMAGEPARRAILELIGPLSVSLEDDPDFSAHASQLVRLLSSAAAVTVHDEAFGNRVHQITLRLITRCFGRVPDVPAKWAQFWPNVTVQGLLGNDHQKQHDATKLAEEAMTVCTQTVRDACHKRHQSGPRHSEAWVLLLLEPLLLSPIDQYTGTDTDSGGLTGLPEKVISRLFAFAASIALVDASQHKVAQGSILAAVAPLRAAFQSFLQNLLHGYDSGKPFLWSQRPECVQAAFALIVCPDKTVAALMGRLAKVGTSPASAGIADALRQLATEAKPSAHTGSPRRGQRLSLGSHFISGVWTTLAQLVELNPLRCRNSLMAIFLHLRSPDFLRAVLGDPNWGAECLHLSWNICKVVMQDLHKSDGSEMLIVRTFEFISAVWPSVVRSMAPGVDADGRQDCAVWFSDFLSWGLYPKPAALRRWEGVLKLLLAELPAAVQQGATALPASILEKVAPTARKVLNCKHTTSAVVVEKLTQLCDSAAAAMPKKTSKNSQVTMIDLTGRSLPQQSAGAPVRYVKITPSQRPGLESSSFSAAGAGAGGGEPRGRSSGVRFIRTAKKHPLLKVPAPNWRADHSSSSDSGDDSDDCNAVADRQKPKPAGGAAGRAKRRPAGRNMLEELADEMDSDPLLQRYRAMQASKRKDQNAARLKTSVLPTASHAKWQESRTAVAPAARRPKPDLNGLHKHILGWNFDSLDNTVLPAVEAVPDSFPNIEDYIARFEPLLIHECHAHVCKARDDIGPSPDRSLYMPLRKANMQRIDAFTFVGFEFLDDKAQMPRQHDIVMVSLNQKQAVGRSAGGEVDQGRILCMVDNLKAVPGARKKRQKHRELRLKFFIEDGVHGRIMRNQLQKSSWQACHVMNMATLNPRKQGIQCSHVDLEAVPGLIGRVRGQHNPSQWQAIESAMSRDRLVLLQGPPGTGKTKTIIGIVMAFLEATAKDSPEPRKRPRVFVCAPSNAAADEIALRIMHERGSGNVHDPKIGIPVVRIGNPGSVHELVKPVHLELLIEKKLGDTAKNAVNAKGDQELRNGQQEEHQKLNEDIGNIHVEREKLIGDRQAPDYEQLTVQLKRLHSRKDEVTSAMNASFGAMRRARAMAVEMKLKAKLDILNCAQVLCCTLSASGSDALAEGVRGADLIIIDEAAQATEISTLIPLKHLQMNRGRCILVGDPCQLPATVLSQAASSLRYERSLFERLHKCRFPVIMLDTQYRMHPAIRRFPSIHFYENKLRDSPSVQSRKAVPYTTRAQNGPCVFWDVRGDETRRGMSWCNTTEAQVVVALLQSLFTQFPGIDFKDKIGVLTPYQSQLRELRRHYELSLTKTQQLCIESNTVDAFQGREKEIIIFSCVRAGAQRGIGFVADTRRMNVALTRAKHAIWVVGNAKSLSRNQDWRSYIGHLRNAGHGVYTVKSGDECAAVLSQGGSIKAPKPATAKSNKRPREDVPAIVAQQKKSQRAIPVAPDAAVPIIDGKVVKGIVNHRGGDAGSATDYKVRFKGVDKSRDEWRSAAQVDAKAISTYVDRKKQK